MNARDASIIRESAEGRRKRVKRRRARSLFCASFIFQPRFFVAFSILRVLAEE